MLVNNIENIFLGREKIKKIIYNSQSTSFDQLNNKLFVSNGLITATATTLFDTSTLVGDQLYPIGTKIFYAIDDHTLMEVDDTEN